MTKFLLTVAGIALSTNGALLPSATFAQSSLKPAEEAAIRAACERATDDELAKPKYDNPTGRDTPFRSSPSHGFNLHLAAAGAFAFRVNNTSARTNPAHNYGFYEGIGRA
jgi:hypothetical protein